MTYLECPYGMNDKLLEDAALQAEIESAVEGHLKLWGFNRIVTPIVEHYQVFAKREPEFEEEELYKLIDKNGRILALRPDITIPCVRVISTKLKSYPKPIKIFYRGTVYRSSTQLYESCESTQLGAEVFGTNGLYADVEILTAAIEGVEKSGLKDFKIDICHAGIFQRIIRGLGLSIEREKQLRKHISEKNLVELQDLMSELNISENSKALLLKLPSLFGSYEAVLTELEKILPDYELNASLNYLKTLLSILNNTFDGLQLSVDIGMISELNYYTGIIFKGYANGASEVILSGGRYDSLTLNFGYDCSAAGFAIYIEQLVKAIKYQTKEVKALEKLLVLFDDENYDSALSYCRGKRESGVTANLVYYSKKMNIEQYMMDYGYAQVRFFIGEGGSSYAEGSSSKG